MFLALSSHNPAHQAATQQQQNNDDDDANLTAQRPPPLHLSQRAYPHLSLLRTAVAAVALAALLFRPLNSGVQERVKKGELFFVHMKLFIGLLH